MTTPKSNCCGAEIIPASSFKPETTCGECGERCSWELDSVAIKPQPIDEEMDETRRYILRRINIACALTHPKAKNDYWKVVEQETDFIYQWINTTYRSKVIDEVIEILKDVDVDLKGADTDYGQGWHDASLEWTIKIVDLKQKLQALKLQIKKQK